MSEHPIAAGLAGVAWIGIVVITLSLPNAGACADLVDHDEAQIFRAQAS